MIYTRIDTYSAVLNNACIKDVLDLFNVNTTELDKIFDSQYKSSDVQFGSTFVYTINGIRIEVKFSEYKMLEDKEAPASSIFTFPFSYLRLYLSSEGIDYIMKLNEDVEGWNFIDLISCPDFIGSVCDNNFFVTRCDFAYDFINEKDKEFKEFRKFISQAGIDEELAPNGRLLNGYGGGLSFCLRAGSERTVYLGSTGSDRMLRVYDKKFQLTKKGYWEEEKIPYGLSSIEIESWHRVEFQCRNNYAHNYLLHNPCDFVAIMGDIKDYFLFKDAKGKFCRAWHSIINLGQKSELYKRQIAPNRFQTTSEAMAEWYVNNCSTADDVNLISCNCSDEEAYYKKISSILAKARGVNGKEFVYKRNKTLMEAKAYYNISDDVFWRKFYVHDETGVILSRNPFLTVPLGPYSEGGSSQ